MSKIQTRRSVSVRGDTYARLREYAKLRDESMSDVLEKLLDPLLRGVPEPTSPSDVPRVQDVRW